MWPKWRGRAPHPTIKQAASNGRATRRFGHCRFSGWLILTDTFPPLHVGHINDQYQRYILMPCLFLFLHVLCYRHGAMLLLSHLQFVSDHLANICQRESNVILFRKLYLTPPPVSYPLPCRYPQKNSQWLNPGISLQFSQTVLSWFI